MVPHELAKRGFARHRPHFFRMRDLLFGQRMNGCAQHFPVQAVFAGKMVVDGRLIDPRFGNDRPHAGVVIAALGEQPLRRPEDAVAGDF